PQTTARRAPSRVARGWDARVLVLLVDKRVRRIQRHILHTPDDPPEVRCVTALRELACFEHARRWRPGTNLTGNICAHCRLTRTASALTIAPDGQRARTVARCSPAAGRCGAVSPGRLDDVRHGRQQPANPRA